MAEDATKKPKGTRTNPKRGKGGKAGARTVELKTDKMNSDLSGLKKPQAYMDFILFMAIPDVLRQELMDVSTQQEFAEKYKVNTDTLVEWKKRVGFWDDVVSVRKEFFRARTANVILALETKSLDPQKVQGQDVRILLTYTGEYSEKTETEHKVHPELAAALEKIGKVLG